MALLEWSEALSLDLPLMDNTHQEFVELITRLEDADDEALLPLWQSLIDHTEAHFGQEDRWMASTRFSSGNCHAVQHKVVLQVLHEAHEQVRQGQQNLALMRQLTKDLAVWFPQHAQSMDAALALHLRRVGYDPLTGQVNAPDALPADLIEGCGGGSCSSQGSAPDAEQGTAQHTTSLTSS